MYLDRHYSGSLTREQFLFYEMRIVASLLCAGRSREEIYEQVAKEDLFQYPTERTVRSITTTCLKRLDALASPTMVHHIANASPAAARQAILYAMMRENAIVYDFMTDVVGEKLRTQQLELSSKDIMRYLDVLSEYYPPAADWSDSTRTKLRQVLTRCLVECRYLDSFRSQALRPVFLYPEVEEGIRQLGDITALSAFGYFE